jgi:Zn-finger nucleic acid-binding protein
MPALPEEVGRVQEHCSTYDHILRWLDRGELERMLGECGFRTTRIYGDWDMRDFSEEDHRMIFVAERI